MTYLLGSRQSELELESALGGQHMAVWGADASKSVIWPPSLCSICIFVKQNKNKTKKSKCYKDTRVSNGLSQPREWNLVVAAPGTPRSPVRRVCDNMPQMLSARRNNWYLFFCGGLIRCGSSMFGAHQLLVESLSWPDSLLIQRKYKVFFLQ